MWLCPLPSSLWADEMGTMFVVHHGSGDPSLTPVPQLKGSLYYLAPALAERLFGFSEVACRLPSMVFMGLALILLARIAADAIHPRAGWLAALTCFIVPQFNDAAIDARPYALGILLAAAGLWSLMRWLESERSVYAVLFVLSGALLWRVHLIFWPMYIAFGVTALAVWRSGTTRVRGTRIAIVFGALAISLLPVISAAVALQKEAARHIVAPLPSWLRLHGALKLNLVLAWAAIPALVARARGWGRSGCRPQWRWILGWWLCQPLCLALYSWSTGNNLMVARYQIIAIPGAILAAAALASLFLPERHWERAALAAGLAALIYAGQWSWPVPMHGWSDWRGAAQAVNSQGLAADTPIVCPSPFIEAQPPVWRPGYPTSSFLYSHLEIYPVKGRPYAFPILGSPEAESYAARLSTDVLRSGDRFVVYGATDSARLWREWFGAREEFAHWRVRSLGRFAGVEAFVFEQPGAGSPRPSAASRGPAL
jgi:hypothetical protein